MTPERYQRVCDVFERVVARAPEGRTSYLEATCGQDETLQADVQALIAGHEVAERDGFLEVPSFVIDAIPRELPDFGNYEKIEYIGHGGMGVVYRAASAVPSIQRRSAPTFSSTSTSTRPSLPCLSPRC